MDDVGGDEDALVLEVEPVLGLDQAHRPAGTKRKRTRASTVNSEQRAVNEHGPHGSRHAHAHGGLLWFRGPRSTHAPPKATARGVPNESANSSTP